MGLFPNPGQNVYLITPPFFPSVSIRSPLTGKTATIVAENFDSSYNSIYIQSATLDGVPYTKNWIDHSFFTDGKLLVLRLGDEESTWGTKLEDLPPSSSEYTGTGNGSVNGTVGVRREKRWFNGGGDVLDLSPRVM
jgi:putative alpha-1,2-mannosidase